MGIFRKGRIKRLESRLRALEDLLGLRFNNEEGWEDYDVVANNYNAEPIGIIGKLIKAQHESEKGKK